MNVAKNIFLTPLGGVDPKRYSICLLGPLALGLSLGIQVTLTGLLMWGPGDHAGIASQLTDQGKIWANPENDLAIFLAGSCATMAAVLVMVWYWRAKLASLKSAHLAETMTASAVVQVLLAMMSLLACLLLASGCWFSHDFHIAPNATRPLLEMSDGISLMIPALLALLCAVLDLESGWLGMAAPVAGFERWRRRAGKFLLWAVPILIVLAVGVPPGRWSSLADQFFAVDLHHHLNFYMMGPALLFEHGRAFGTEIYSQYGIGWPLVSFLLSRFSCLSYGTLIGTEIVYVCIYYLALFFLVRNYFRETVWAAVALGLAIYWQMFSGMNPHELIWVFPSSTAMRHPMDVWFFLAIIMHQRSEKPGWIALAGLAAALGVIFETETGIYLIVTFFVYTIFQAGRADLGGRARGFKRQLAAPLIFCGTAGVTALAMFLYASRGALFTGAFWSGWGEAFRMYAGQGIGALPVAEMPDSPFVLFICMITLYLGVIAHAVIRGWHRSLGDETILMASIAAYGMALLLLFVNRSHPYNLCHATIPVAVLLTGLLARGYSVLQQWRAYSLLPWVMVCGLAGLIFIKPEFQRYPSCLRSFFDGAPSARPTVENFPAEFGEVSARIRALAPDGQNVGIMDYNDTALYYLSNARPWSRYASLFHMILTQPSLEELQRQVVENPPRYVVIRGKDQPRPPRWEFVWAPLYGIVSQRYQLRETSGPYEIWQLPSPGQPGK